MTPRLFLGTFLVIATFGFIQGIPQSPAEDQYNPAEKNPSERRFNPGWDQQQYPAIPIDWESQSGIKNVKVPGYWPGFIPGGSISKGSSWIKKQTPGGWDIGGGLGSSG